VRINALFSAFLPTAIYSTPRYILPIVTEFHIVGCYDEVLTTVGRHRRWTLSKLANHRPILAPHVGLSAIRQRRRRPTPSRGSVCSPNKAHGGSQCRADETKQRPTFRIQLPATTNNTLWTASRFSRPPRPANPKGVEIYFKSNCRFADVVVQACWRAKYLAKHVSTRQRCTATNHACQTTNSMAVMNYRDPHRHTPHYQHVPSTTRMSTL
jgi:hypothetical protein